VKKDLDELMKKQKEQLSKDKEKLQKKHSLFSTSFGSTLAGLQQQAPQTERHYQSLNNQNKKSSISLKQRYISVA